MKKRFITALIILIIIVPILVFSDPTIVDNMVGNFIFVFFLSFFIGLIQFEIITFLFDKTFFKDSKILSFFIISTLLMILNFIIFVLIDTSIINLSTNNHLLSYSFVFVTISFTSLYLICFGIIFKFSFDKIITFFILNFLTIIFIISLYWLLTPNIIFDDTIHNQLIGLKNGVYISLLFFPILVSISFDTFAYFIGKKFGKHLQALIISPKKTWEGFFGGYLISIIISVLYMQIFGLVIFNVLDSTIFKNIVAIWISLSIILPFLLPIISAFGDLFFSLIKRKFNKKDYSNLLPGHGGILDRVDSHIFTITTFTLIIYFVEVLSI